MDIGGEHIVGLQQLDAQNGNEHPSDANVNISDVLEAVALADPSFGAGGAVGMAQAPAMQQATVKIVEQPAPKALRCDQPAAMQAAVRIVEQPVDRYRFRYECEGRSAGSIPGVNSTAENKTYPTIRIDNFVGQVTIVVSCVTKDEPFKPHPHNLVGRERCERGVCTIRSRITEDANEYQFKNLGIQCVKRKDVADALQTRAALRVDPFRTGFEHRNNPQSIDLNAVRLAFQVFLHEANGRQGLFQLKPAVSDVIYDKKAMCDLHIMRASHCSGTVNGGTQIILLCEKVTREDTAVMFYQEDGMGRVVWEACANTVLVHKQVAIVFETPPYKPQYYDPNSHRGQIIVNFQLKRITDNQRSNSLPFEYIPEFQDHPKKRKTVMPSVVNYEPERFIEQSIKLEPNRTPPHIYSPPVPSYPEAQVVAGQWAQHNPFVEAAGAWSAQYGPQQPQQQQHLQPLSPQYGSSPTGARSPLGALSPHANLQSPLAPTHSPLAPTHSPLGPTMSPALVHHPHQPHQPPQHHQVQQPTYQLVDTTMDTGSGDPSLSSLLNVVAEAPLQHELFSLSSLVEDRENLSDSLRQLSTNDLFRQ